MPIVIDAGTLLLFAVIALAAIALNSRMNRQH